MRQINLTRDEFTELSTDLLDQGGVLRFTARGSSMYPFILPGDVLTVVQVDPNVLKTGDVIFYHSVQGRLIAHRLVKKHTQGGQLTLSARGDSIVGPPEHVPVSDVLGRVGLIKRGTKTLYPRAGFYSYLGILWWSLYPLGSNVLRLRSYLQRYLLSILLRMQSLKIYRFFGGKMLSGKVSCRIANTEDDNALSRLYNIAKLPKIDDPEKSFTLQLAETREHGWVLLACLGEHVVGGILTRNFLGDADISGWWIFGLYVRPRYRGCGIGEKLVQMTLDVLETNGVQQVSLEVPEVKHAALYLFQKVGFRLVDAPPSGSGGNLTAHSGSPRIVHMWRSLGDKDINGYRFLGG